MPNYDIGIDRPSRSQWVAPVPTARRPVLGRAAAIITLRARSALCEFHRAGTTISARGTNETRRILDQSGRAPGPDNARQSIDSHKNRYIAHIFPVSYDYCEFVAILGRLICSSPCLFGLRIAVAGTTISTMQASTTPSTSKGTIQSPGKPAPKAFQYVPRP